MIEILKQQYTPQMPDDEKLNRVREYLQWTILKILYDKNFFETIVFVGGTALRVLFDLKRFSEDLDFSLIQKKGYDFDRITAEIVRGFSLYGLKIELKEKKESAVHGAFFKFSGLLKELGLSSLESQKLSIKVEVDSNPPLGGHTLTTLVNKTYVFSVHHYDLASMFATKLHACFYRKYTKGRDFYDFIWYVSKKVVPNYTLLNNAILQTQGKDPEIDGKNFKEFLLKGIGKIDFKAAQKDVERFLEDKSELRLFDTELISKSIESVY